MIVMLDSGPAGFVIHPKGSQTSRDCSLWIEAIIAKGHLVALPEIVDYELRREIIRRDRKKSLWMLDQLARQLVFVPVTTAVFRQAAELWALARQQGIPTADDEALDCDMILAAHAIVMQSVWGQETVIATPNVRHLDAFVDAREWQDISCSALAPRRPRHTEGSAVALAGGEQLRTRRR